MGKWIIYSLITFVVFFVNFAFIVGGKVSWEARLWANGIFMFCYFLMFLMYGRQTRFVVSAKGFLAYLYVVPIIVFFGVLLVNGAQEVMSGNECEPFVDRSDFWSVMIDWLSCWAWPVVEALLLFWGAIVIFAGAWFCLLNKWVAFDILRRYYKF